MEKDVEMYRSFLRLLVNQISRFTSNVKHIKLEMHSYI